MEAWQVIAGIVVAFAAYLGLSNVQHTKQIAVMQKSIDNLSNQVTLLATQVNLFLKSEIDTLKEIAESVRK
jgi:hypothetical protein